MLAFASFIVVFSLLHIAIGRTRRYISTNFVITPDIIGVFELKGYLVIHTLTTNFNRGYGDPVVKTCVKKRNTYYLLIFHFLVNE